MKRHSIPYLKTDSEGYVLNGLWKFVKVNGEYRWIEAGLGGGGHQDLVDDDETAESAGTVFIFRDYWRMYGSYSTYLSVGCKGGEYKEITEMLDRPHDDGY